MAASSSTSCTLHRSEWVEHLFQFVDSSKPSGHLTPACQKTISKILGQEVLIPIASDYFEFKKTLNPDFHGNRLCILPSSVKDIRFFYLNNTIFALKKIFSRTGGFKELFVGVNLETAEPISFLIGKTKNCWREIQVVKALNSSTSPKPLNICNFVATATLRDKTFILTPFCNRFDLFDYRERVVEKSHRFQLHTARKVIRAINFIHSQGFIHFDIKPHNILVSVHRNAKNKVVTTIKVADFGAAVNHMETLEKVDPIGTLIYASPEQLRIKRVYELYHKSIKATKIYPEDLLQLARELSFSSDIYSLSLTFDDIFCHSGVKPSLHTNYWNDNWGKQSTLLSRDPIARPTAATLLKQINSDIRREKIIILDQKTI